VLEQKINEFFGDAESTGFGTAGGVGYCQPFLISFLRSSFVPAFPQLLSSSNFVALSNAHHARLIQCLIVGQFYLSYSSILRKKKILALTEYCWPCGHGLGDQAYG